jgi:hypothetical protein
MFGTSFISPNINFIYSIHIGLLVLLVYLDHQFDLYNTKIIPLENITSKVCSDMFFAIYTHIMLVKLTT